MFYTCSCIQSVPIYLSEVAPYKYRGALNMTFQLFITIGILIANFLNFAFAKWIEGEMAWRLNLGGVIVPGLIIFIGSCLLPDTPNSEIERGNYDRAKEQLLKLRKVDNVDEEFNDLVEASEKAKLVQHAWLNIFERKYRPQLFFAFCIPMFQQLTGMNVIVFYAPILFKTIGFGSNASLFSSLITGIVNMLATFVSISTVDKFGRKKLFLYGGLQMLVSQVCYHISSFHYTFEIPIYLSSILCVSEMHAAHKFCSFIFFAYFVDCHNNCHCYEVWIEWKPRCDF